MGMFDTLLIRCPNCGEIHEQQTKTDPCLLLDYELHAAPLDVLAYVAHRAIKCLECGNHFLVEVQTMATVVPTLQLEKDNDD